MNKNESPRILIVRLSALGDVIHTLACLDRLRQTFPQAYIAWVVEELSRDLLLDHPQLDEVFVIPKKRWRGHFFKYSFSEILPFYKTIRSRRFDVAIDFQGLTKSGVVTLVSGARRRIGFAGSSAREINRWFTNERIDPGPQTTHIIDRNLSLLKNLAPGDGPSRRIFPDRTEWRQYVDGWISGETLPAETRFIAINPGAGWITKRWPLERFAQVGAILSKRLERLILITWGPGEEMMSGDLKENIEAQGGRAILAPPTTVGQSIELTRRCDLFIGGDTGPIHLAAALEVPVVAIYGASDGKRNHPGGTRQVMLQDAPECGPCWKKTMHEGCDLDCLKRISVENVVEGAMSLLGITP